MVRLDWYGVVALVLIVVTFVFVRRVTAFVAAGVAIVLGFIAATYSDVDWSRASEWIVILVGLAACAFGLLIVRVMLVRSVSLKLLATIDGRQQGTFGENIGNRLHDMRAARLIRTRGEQISLTPFGQFASLVVAVTYSVFRIDT